MNTSKTEKEVVFSFIEYLNGLTESKEWEKKTSEIQCIMDLLGTSFDMNIADENQQKEFKKTKSLLEVWDDHFNPRDPEKALEYKDKGNQMIRTKKYQEAIDFYVEGLKYDNKNIALYSNRAAAHNYLKEFDKAIGVCEDGIKIDPTFSKLYSHLGFAYFQQHKYSQSLELGYQKALELSPENKNYQVYVQKCKNHLNAPKKNQGQGGGIDFSNLGQMFGQGGGGGGMNMDFINNLMNSEQGQQLMQNFMQNPNLMNNVGQITELVKLLQNNEFKEKLFNHPSITELKKDEGFSKFLESLKTNPQDLMKHPSFTDYLTQLLDVVKVVKQEMNL
ncbi:hypothetical protein M0812_11401 [Anaeramoeba flamelloides]|uniref:Uncharacterized protein n=1 Tax=Anaeramoeba flamelloides TaxID=1746091 RepID=A0AAV7ZZZ9_9EUKA|nr:hypothetical protein M0812_11401 [Anaeramoeba flamelloides]|eukprot:Anaeramoba_flamelloidesa813310_162.p1 GENE.a813310_162~~a813310_162.p1  ORF type:complete len:333 (+),score=100.80 a813310_162:33-1031(+)